MYEGYEAENGDLPDRQVTSVAEPSFLHREDLPKDTRHLVVEEIEEQTGERQPDNGVDAADQAPE